ncbi:hypothetical protein FKM82_016047 [Ascaphus truei]
MYQCSLADVLGFIQSIYMYQEFLKQDRDGATEFLQRVEKRFCDTLGESSNQVTLQFHMTCYCVLACKS